MFPLRSQVDPSTNFVEPVAGSRLFLESRYVRRTDDEVICYLSTQTGCNQGCRMCHLTQTGQAAGVRAATENEIVAQAEHVLDHYREAAGPRARTLNYNFMARGEPLLVFGESVYTYDLFDRLWSLASEHNLIPRFKVSTIIPRGFRHRLIDVFPKFHPDIYWSVYAADGVSRRKWLPNASSVEDGVRLLKEWQSFTHKEVRIHYAVIRGVNDRPTDVAALLAALGGLRYAVNLVRYNSPFGPSALEEGDVEKVAATWRWFGVRTVIVPRVGPDVFASCGTFYSGGGGE